MEVSVKELADYTPAGASVGRELEVGQIFVHAPITFVVLTFNEERNLEPCLASVANWAQEIFCVDSGSTDRTLEIAEKYGARIFSHPFESHSQQWTWTLGNLPIATDWVIALDADQRVMPELREELSRKLSESPEKQPAGYFVRRRQVFRGRWIKYGGYYPKYLLKCFRMSAVWVDDDLVDHHFRVRGEARKLDHDIIEDNQNEANISVWIEKHNRYATLQAREEINRNLNNEGRNVNASFWGTPDERILWLKNRWARLPLFLRPLLYFTYRYFFRLGFLDGKEGFIFHFLQGFWYRLLVDIKIEELRNEQRNANE